MAEMSKPKFPNASPKPNSRIIKKLETWNSETLIASSLCFIPADDNNGNDVIGIGLTTQDEIIFAAGFFTIYSIQEFIDNLQVIIDKQKRKPSKFTKRQ